MIEVTGKPITDFQEGAATGAPRSATSAVDELPIDPVAHYSPPLTGARARAAHGPKLEHHAATLDRHRTVPDGAVTLEPAPPEHPERLYLHYLLLHLDRLSLPSLWYLRRQVNDEIALRARPPPPSPPAE